MAEEAQSPDPSLSAPKMAAAHLAAIVASSDDAIVSKDLDGIIQSWNSGAERLFGYTAEEAVGRPIRMVIPEDRQYEEDMILDRIQRGEAIDHFETIRRHKDGSELQVSVTVSPVQDGEGRVVGASKIARDIGPLRRADVANARLAAIIESSDDAIVSKDLNGVVESWNRGAERLFGYLAEEMIGRSILVLLPPDRQDEESRILARLRRGERVDHFETVRVRKDGRPVDVSVTISPIRDGTGKIIGASKVARDISERKIYEAAAATFTLELEERVRERTVELQEAHREMEAFTYSIAHDLRAPIRAIVATSRMVVEDYGDCLPEEGRQMLDRQVASAKQLSRLVDDLLSYSRLGRSAPEFEEIDLGEVAQNVWAELKEPGYELMVRPGLSACGDPSLLRLLLQNLLDNARKFSPEGGRIEVGKEGNAFFVRDRGIGFEMAYAERIFVPFERLVTNAFIPGTGIGLANSRRIVEKHQGSIWVQSELGAGTTVYFTLGT